ncbi:MAG: phosphatase PAP2 family protein [Sphingobacteriales bacterium]|nr:MAG: phosphatase PAP2 family protein [Sphingobacteriales bacterium]TAF81761.1 MAG: phosphatase PAP2 family protein [Sphingobacteriales bacterium]
MLEKIIQLDYQLFYTINTGLSNPVFDFLMPILRNKLVWIPFYLAIIYYFIKTYKLNGVFLTLTLATCIAFADFTSASVIKKTVKRPRPCNDLAFMQRVTIRVPCGTGFSFPSTHATDHFAIALFLITLFFKKYKYTIIILLSWAFLIAFAQVYVGVHFPTDVLCGTLYGALIGCSFASFFKYKFPKLILA